MDGKKEEMTHPNAKISDEEFVKAINPDAHERIEGGRVGIFVGIDQSINSGRYIGGGYSSAEAWANAKANVETDIRLRAWAPKTPRNHPEEALNLKKGND